MFGISTLMTLIPILHFFYVDGIVSDDASFIFWKTLTRNAGNRMDENSTLVVPPSSSYYLVLNEYDNTRIHLAVFNWNEAANLVTIDICCLLSSQISWVIYDAETPYVVTYDSTTVACNSIDISFSGDANEPNFRSLVIVITNNNTVNIEIPLRTCGDSYIEILLSLISQLKVYQLPFLFVQLLLLLLDQLLLLFF